jgi:PAS domain S-box-containing protein
LAAESDFEKDVSGDMPHRIGSADTARLHEPGVSVLDQFEQLRKTLNAIPAYTWYAVPTGALTFVDERSAENLGLPEDHPLRSGTDAGAPWDYHVSLLHPDDQEETRRSWANCLRTGSGGEVSFRVRNGAGEYRWYLARVEPVRAGDGTLLYWIGITLDVEALKQAEFYLQEGQRLAHIGSWALSSDGFEYWSPQLFEIYGLDPSGGAPSIQKYITLVHPEDRDFVAQAIDKMLSDHRPSDLTKRIVRRDGKVRHVRCVGIPGPDGGFLGTAIDVTEQEELTRALRKREEELRQILDLTPQLIAVFGPNNERIYVNRGALDYLGATLEEWIGDRLVAEGRPEIYPDDMERLQARLAIASSDCLPFEVEVRVRRSDGNYRWFLARYNPVRDDDGQILRWYVACTDIDERKRHEESLQQENAALREEISQASMFEEIAGSSAPLRKVLSEISKVARADSTVLILGETGTGKELIARAIHRRSGRAPRPFVGVNCAAIPTSLIASELFGHEKGAFTGATQRRLGRFESANGGTIFLDEVGDLPPDIQIALLRVLQERQIERVGGDKPVSVDVRVLAATHRNLERLVSEGKFRQDLFYRLNVVPITMPPLRERAADIPVLVEYFIARFGKKVGKKFGTIGKKTMELLSAYEWPGNVRELQNVIERAVTLSESETFTVDEAWLKRQPAAIPESGAALDGVLLAHEREAIEAALAQCHGRVAGPTGAAVRLGLPASTLDSKIKRLGIDKYRFKSGSDA